VKKSLYKLVIRATWTVVFCCFAPLFASQVNDLSDQKLSPPIEHNTKLDEPGGIFCESFRVVSNLSPGSVVRDLLNGFVGLVPKFDLIYESKIRQVIWLSENHPINLSPTDIIFPFHYFW
jgi:hypothetical protein